MNVTVFGATGTIGQLTVADLLDRGDTVTVHAVVSSDRACRFALGHPAVRSTGPAGR